MKPKLSFLLLFLSLLLGGAMSQVRAQDWAVKSNLIYDATATVNLGVEVGVAPQWTIDLSGNLNAWSPSNRTRWNHWLAQPEVR